MQDLASPTPYRSAPPTTAGPAPAPATTAGGPAVVPAPRSSTLAGGHSTVTSPAAVVPPLVTAPPAGPPSTAPAPVPPSAAPSAPASSVPVPSVTAPSARPFLAPSTSAPARPDTATPPPAVEAPVLDADARTAAQRYGWGTATKLDTFDDPAVTGWGRYNGPGHAGNGIRSAGAVTAQDGVLRLSGDANGSTGGMAWGAGQQYGRWEVRMRAPVGDSSYHALALLWPDAENWPVGGEVDFVEISDAARQKVDGFLHYGASNSQASASTSVDATQWHNWAVEWAPGGITYFLDGVPWFQVTDPAKLPPGPMHLCLQLDWFPDGGAITPTQMQVDDVAYYPLNGAGASPAIVPGAGAATPPAATPPVAGQPGGVLAPTTTGSAPTTTATPAATMTPPAPATTPPVTTTTPPVVATTPPVTTTPPVHTKTPPVPTPPVVATTPPASTPPVATTTTVPTTPPAPPTTEAAPVTTTTSPPTTSSSPSTTPVAEGS